MPALDSTTVQSINLLIQGGRYQQPADSGVGALWRPAMYGERGGRLATVETLLDFFIDDVADPDEAKRRDPEIETKIAMHPAVQGAFRKRETTVKSYPWNINPAPDAPDKRLARVVSDYVKKIWSNLPNVQHLYQQMQGAVLNGGVGIEWRWQMDAAGYEYPVQFFPVHKSRFVFDRLGNMGLKTRDFPVWGAYVAMGMAQNVKYFPRGKFMYHVYRAEPGSWEQPDLEGYIYWGKGEDVALYYPVTFDYWVLRFRLKWLEMYGIPPTRLYYPDGEQTGMLARVYESLRGESITAIPRETGGGAGYDSLYHVEQATVPSMSNDAFTAFSKDWTEPHINTILLGSSDENAKGEKGGYSDHVSRRDAGPQIYFLSDANNIDATINTQLIPAIVLARFPNCPSEYFPVHKLEPAEEKDRAQEMDIAEKTAKLVPVVEDEIYDRSGFRKPAEGEKTVFNGQAQGGGQDPFDIGGAGGQGAPQGMPQQQPGRTPSMPAPGQPRQQVAAPAASVPIIPNNGAPRTATPIGQGTAPGTRDGMSSVAKTRTFTGRGR